MAKWWNDKNIEVVNIEGRMIALDGWNGERYCDSWEVEEIINGDAFGVKKEGIEVEPVTEETGDEDYEVTGYKIVVE